jgi:hypothetical protein
LGSIDRESKIISVIDSLGTNQKKNNYGVIFYVLLELMNLINNSGFISYEPSNWKLIISNDCASQADGHSCCLFVILNTMSMFLGFQLTETNDPVRVRYWVYDLIQKYNETDQDLERLRSLPLINPMHLESMDITDDPTNRYIRYLINSLKLKTEKE